MVQSNKEKHHDSMRGRMMDKLRYDKSSIMMTLALAVPMVMVMTMIMTLTMVMMLMTV